MTMTHFVKMVACAAACLFSAAGGAATYDLSAYQAPATGPWVLNTTSTPLSDSSARVDVSVSNGLTTNTFSIVDDDAASPVEFRVNQRGEVLMNNVSGPSGPSSLSLYSGGQVTNLGGLGVDVATWRLREDGAVEADGSLYDKGAWSYFWDSPRGDSNSAVYGINDAKVLVGIYGLKAAWGPFSSQVLTYPTLLGGVSGFGAEGFISAALDINNTNLIVGWQANNILAPTRDLLTGVLSPSQVETSFAVIWGEQQAAYDLNSLIDPQSALFGQVHLSKALSIDDAGNIQAEGYYLNDLNRVAQFKLTVQAVPEAGTLGLMALGLLAIGGVRRRTLVAAQQAKAA
jgi:hypothetical protein